MIYPVTKDPANAGEIIYLDMKDVVFVESDNRSVIFHTIDGTFYPLIPKIITLESHLVPIGFRKLDRTNLVNIHKIRGFDEHRAVVFFEPEFTNNSKFATISNFEKNQVRKQLREWIDTNNKEASDPSS